jgi:tetratricopeptide (TPR) repeat protein
MSHCNLGTVYRELGNNNSAVESFKTALQLNPRMSRAHFGLALCYYSQGLYADAAQHFILCHDLDDNQSGLKEFSFQWNLKCLKKTDKQAALIENLTRGVNELKYNGAIIGNILCEPYLNQYLKNPFCDDPLNYMVVTNLMDSPYFSENLRNSLLSFCENFSGEGKQQGLLVNGFQTPGDLFLQGDPLFDDVRSIIMSEVLRYKERFKSVSEGLFEQWPATIKIRGWIVSYLNGGAIKPHIHEDGWLSGSLYINVPEDCKGSEGNLLLSDSEKVDVEALNKNTDLLVPVKTGDLCLFPASLTHCTVPFSSTERRIVLAFDILK